MKLTALLSLLLVPLAHAQDFAITSSNFGGGGGSSGDGYTVSGSVTTSSSQPLTGGDYSVTPGFLAGVVVLQTPGAPRLTLRRNGAALELVWTTADSAWTLESTLALGSTASWANAPESASQSGNERTVTLGAVTGVRFFRLRRAPAN